MIFHQLVCFFIIVTFSVAVSARSANVKQVLSPQFDRSNENVTVTIGSNAVIPCYVNNLGIHKVAWLKASDNDILAMEDSIITNDDRFKLLHGYINDWSLSIQPVSEEDQGEYICQINTEPPIISRVILRVLLPPKIIEDKSSVMPAPVMEGQTLKLYCHAEGIPHPEVSWYFRHHSKNSVQKRDHHRMRHIRHSVKNQIYQEGSTLVIRNISTQYSGIFECIANNSVPPAASRKIKVNVEFEPEIEMQTTEVEQRLGLDVRLECRIKANPLINHYWMKNDEVIDNTLINMQGDQANFIKDLHNQDKYEINIYNQNNKEYLTISSLVIKNLKKEDFGKYQCFAVNAYNTTKGELELKELEFRSHQKPTKMAASRILFFNNNDQSRKSSIEDYRITTREPRNHLNQSVSKEMRLNKKADSLGFYDNKSTNTSLNLTNFISLVLTCLLLRNFS